MAAKKNKMLVTAAAGITAVAIGAGALAGVVNAGPNEQATPTPAPRAGASATPGAGRQQAQQYVDDFLADLARNLGVTPDKLRDALKQTGLQQIDKAQQSGRVTADQAQRARDAINSGNAGGLFGGFGHGFPGAGPGFGPGKGGLLGGANHVGRLQIATFLGISEDALRTELQGKSLAQVAQAHGKTRDQLKQFMTTTVQQDLAQAVQSGRITQQQADTALAAFNSNVDRMIDEVHDNTRRGPRGR